ncbi:hypothetical protein ACFLX5_00845 [Chloroflexota bacterium]
MHLAVQEGLEEQVPKDLRDYSGPFDPNRRYPDFSKDTLVMLLEEYSRSYRLLERQWHAVLRERHSDREAVECAIGQWMSTRPMVSHWLSKALNIEGDNVETFFKRLQMDPRFTPAEFDVCWELRRPDSGVFTVKKCGTLVSLEEEGKGYELTLCNEQELPALTRVAQYTNPHMKMVPLRLPPRRSETDIACQWEVKLES